jgi:hydroxymethylbilane synthase
MQRLPIRIATRRSPLALAQANLVARCLRSSHNLTKDDIEIVPITTHGDQILDHPMSEIGGKGMFTKEIEDTLLSNNADLAIHSMKDVATLLPNGLEIAAILKREDPRDVLISRNSARSITDLPTQSTLGTASLRRAAQVKSLRPDIKIVMLRGNVGTRLEKVRAGHVGATLLAKAGLSRLGIEPDGSAILSDEEMLPAVGQGAIGIEIRKNDDEARIIIAPLNHELTELAVRAERAFLRALDGSCRTPIAALACLIDGTLSLRGLISTPDGSIIHRTEKTGPGKKADEIGRNAGEQLLDKAGHDFLQTKVSKALMEK